MEKSEDRIQADAYLWFHNTYPQLRGLLYHVPNGGSRHKAEANKFKAMGVVSGIPDIVFHYRGKTYFFEFKKNKNEKPSPNQIKIHQQLDRQRFQVWIVFDVDTFKHLIQTIVLDESDRNTWGLTKEEFTYKTNVFNYLYDLEMDSIVNVDDLVETENKEKFVFYITEFITEGYAKLDNFEILFTSKMDYLYKVNENTDREALNNKYKQMLWQRENNPQNVQ